MHDLHLRAVGQRDDLRLLTACTICACVPSGSVMTCGCPMSPGSICMMAMLPSGLLIVCSIVCCCPTCVTAADGCKHVATHRSLLAETVTPERKLANHGRCNVYPTT